MSRPAIQVENISKAYGPVQALDQVSFSVNQGELFGLIGPDGSGKSSLFRILTTLLLPDKGVANVSGRDAVKDHKKIRLNVGYMPGKFSLYMDLTVEENLSFFATIFGTTIGENYDLIKGIYSQIEPFKHRRAGGLSGGMKQKLALSCALIHRPKVLFLDEPTTGIDPGSREDLWVMLKNLQQRGITQMVSTPYMDEANKCDRIAFMQKGKVLDVAPPKEISQKFSRKLLAVRSRNTGKLIRDLREYPGIHTVHPFGTYLHVALKEENMDTEALKQYLKNRAHAGIEIHPTRPGLEDTFMEMMVQENEQ